ncbi:ABC-type multidrug transport system fused ATPase/permease subunit [Motilibacter rhizosphaerae]|uniref:ABC-type multidrug transport system fused ATPase/permease subunit n=1 Tax=Motilibacter rhizosphaerae TaxID=598652 RepID=A0A4Q7NGK5_9ACTN|nr:ABC transporter ATP-binding protein [Motilibacter rhizosphaerae]RZS82858.1 ABC-type multidrug transport system fused ATPase/permease subunit [Motilibacter rhizosphaerae]
MRRDPARLGWRRLAGRRSTAALALLVLAAAAEVLGAVVGGRLAGGAGAAGSDVALLAVLLLGSALLDGAGSTVVSGVIGRAEQRLRADLLARALHQPLPVLQEQAVGELLDRVDDDVNQAGHLLRTTGTNLARAALRAVLAWVVAGLTWPWAWLLFPAVAAVALLVARPSARTVAGRKLAEEVAWSEHAAQFEEAVAGRDDVRTALGQPHVLRQYARRASTLLARVSATSSASSTTQLRTGLAAQCLMAVLALAGVALVTADRMTLAALVTIWLLASSFVGQLGQVAQHLPEIQAGIGALTRVRALLDSPQEPDGGRPVPDVPADVEFRHLSFAFGDDDGPGFALDDVTFRVPAGLTCALVGRTGSGKSTLTSFLPRALEPPEGTVLVAGQDVRATDLEALRRAVGVVTQRTELLAASLLDNVTLFADVARADVEAAFAALDLEEWVSGLPDGLDTVLGPSGVLLSAGEQQLVAFARLLVRDVRVVVLDEATARMDPETERRVVHASERLLAGRTGLVVAHRLATTERCDLVTVLDAGRVVQHGRRDELVTAPGPFAELLAAAGTRSPEGERVSAPLTRTERRREPRTLPTVRPSLARTVWALLRIYPQWGFLGGIGFGLATVLGVYGAVSGFVWGRLVADLRSGSGTPWPLALVLVACLVAGPVFVSGAFRIYPRWWVAAALRVRFAVLRGQTMQHRLEQTSAGEVTARALDSDRLIWYADRWLDVCLAAIAVAAAAALSGSPLALLVLLGVLLLPALVSALGAPLAGRAAREAGDARARLGQELASALEAVRTVKLSGATATVQAQLERVDAQRVRAHVREYRVRTLLMSVPGVLVQAGVVTAWGVYAAGGWGLADAVLVATTVSGMGWFGIVMGAAVTEAPVARRWLQAAAQLAGTADLVSLPPQVDLVAGRSPLPDAAPRVPLRTLRLEGLTAVHEDGTVGVEGVDLTVDRGSVVLLAGRVGSGKSSLLRSLAGLVDHEGRILWNDEEVRSPQEFLRPGQVAYVSQVPRVLSVSFRDNVTLDHDRAPDPAFETARLHSDLAAAGGDGVLVGQRGVRLSGGQVQRLALARALATEAELLVADDVSSALDARTELELWEGLRHRGTTVIGTSSKRSALARADLVVVLEDGRVVAAGPWRELLPDWGHLAG